MFARRHRRSVKIVLLALVCVLSTQTLAYEFAGGSGEPNDPYQIASAEQLLSIGSDPNLLGKHYELVADIDLAGLFFENAPIAFDANETRSDFQGTSFSGTFNGNGHGVHNLGIAGRGFLGLFGRVDGAVIKDLALEDVVILGAGPHVGGLVGYNNSGWLINCWSSGSVAGTSSVGGLVGYNNYGRPGNCYSTCLVSGDASGGLVGHDRYGTLINCYSSGPIVGGPSTGGLVGYKEYGTTITTNCFWDEEASGRTGSAGGTGKTTDEMQTAATFLDAGWDFRDESNNGLAQTWQMPEAGGYPVLSVFHGYTPPVLAGSGTTHDPYVLTKPADLATVCHDPASSYRLDASLDLSQVNWSLPVVPVFSGSFDGNDHAIHGLTIEGGAYSVLFGRLWSGSQVMNLGVVDANVVGTSYAAAIVGYNSGSVTGCYSTGTVSGTSYVGGLIAYNSGSVAGCHSAGSITATSNYVGGLVGYNSGGGSLANCSSTGPVAGGSSAGGLVGHHDSGTTTNCCSTGSVAGTSNVGGLVGYHNSGTTTNCYSTGSISGTSNVGGLVGYIRRGTTTNCYSTGSATGTSSVGGLVGYKYWGGTVTDCFWDVVTSGQTYSAGGLGLSTPMMQRSQTYALFGWDFVGETANGTEDIWMICQSKDYPRLWWENVVCEGQ